MTTGARTLLLRGIRNWLQINSRNFWAFAIKTVAERLNTLQIYLERPEYISHGVEVEDIPVKYYRTLSCPIYALDAHLQSAVGTGPQK